MIETLHENEWLSLKQVVDPENGVGGYVYSHETRCKGRIIAVLPYRFRAEGIEYLLRREITPCWGMDHNYSALTGGVEESGPLATAIAELNEEAGYHANPPEMISLGISFGTKSTDTIYHLYAVDVSSKTPGEAAGDGSKLDSEGTTEWFSDPDSPDPIVAQMILRFNRFRQGSARQE